MKENRAEIELSDTALEILAYLNEHPDAQDTVEGIARWWLLERQIFSQTRLVERAIRELTAYGFLSETKTGNSKLRYRLERRKKDQISRLLGRGKSARDEK